MPLFPPMVAFDGAGTVVRSGTGKVYAETDVQFATPLPVTDIFGNAITDNLIAITELGTTVAFRTATLFDVIWKSGDLPPIPLSSPRGAREAAEAAQAATAQTLILAQAAADRAQTAAGLVGAPADAIMATVIRNTGSATAQAIAETFQTSGSGLTENQIVTLVATTSSALFQALNQAFITPAELDTALGLLETGGVDEAGLVTLVNNSASNFYAALAAKFGQKVMYVNKVGTTWGPRPTADTTVKVFWTGALPQPAPVTSGTAGMHIGQDVYLLRSAT